MQDVVQFALEVGLDLFSLSGCHFWLLEAQTDKQSPEAERLSEVPGSDL